MPLMGVPGGGALGPVGPSGPQGIQGIAGIGAFSSQHLVRYVDYVHGADNNSGLGPTAAFKTISAAVTDLITESSAIYVSDTPRLGIGTIVCLPGAHDLGTGLVLDPHYPVEIRGMRGGSLGGGNNEKNTKAPLTIFYSSGTPSALVNVYQHSTVFSGQGFAFRDICWHLSSSQTAALYTENLSYTEVTGNLFVSSNDSPLNAYGINAKHDSNYGTDSSWWRVDDNLYRNVGLVTMTSNQGSGQLNRWQITGNNGTVDGGSPLSSIIDCHYGQSLRIFNNNIEVLSGTDVVGLLLDHCWQCTVVGNDGEASSDTQPFISVTHGGYHAFVGGTCLLVAGSSSAGIYASFDSTAAYSTIYNPTIIPSGTTAQKDKVTDANGTNIVSGSVNSGGSSANTQTDNYTLVLTDASKVVEMNKSTSCVLSVPFASNVAFPVGTEIEVCQIGAGQVTVQSAGASASAVSISPSGSDTYATSYATTSCSPHSNRLQLLAILNSRTGAAASTPTVTGCGLTWTQVDTQTFASAASNQRRLTVFRALGTPTPGALTVDFGGVTQSGCQWRLTEFQNIDTSGSNGSSAVVQSAKAAVSADGQDTSLSVTLSAFAASYNRTYVAVAHSYNEDTTPRASWTELGDPGTTYGSPSQALETQWSDAAGAAITASGSWTTSSYAAILAIEVSTLPLTIHSESGNTKLSGQYAVATLRNRSSDEWVLSGDLTA